MKLQFHNEVLSNLEICYYTPRMTENDTAPYMSLATHPSPTLIQLQLQGVIES